jgi:hypothetical protein
LACYSTFTVESGKRPSSGHLSWWHENTPANGAAETARNLAYMRAYLRISGDGRLFAGGLFLEKKRLWMDRSVVSRLERDGYLTFHAVGSEPYFDLTEKGQAAIDRGFV